MFFVLGSASPRRKTILSDYFSRIKIIHPSIDESPLDSESPGNFVQRISREKMKSVEEELCGVDDYIAVTADTIVTIDNLILGKPDSLSSAADMLSLLSGREHRVVTSITVCINKSGSINQSTAMESTSVLFKKLGEENINNYIKLVDCMDKAGSYAIQEHGEMLVESISGSLTNVIGFPLRLFFSVLSRNNGMEFLL
jgi:septum formation protein